MRVFLFVSWVLSAVSLVAAEWKIEVANTRHQREDFVVHAEVNQEWVRLMGKSQLAERLPDGTLVPIPTVLDQSADVPVLTWRLSGETPPERCRTFTLLPRTGQTDIDSDLKVIEGKDEIKISNRYFSLSHPVRGKGGFPRQITYASSRLTDGELYFLDRVVCRGAEGGLRQFFASGFEKSFAKVVFRSPLKVVVEVFSGFAGNPQMSQGTPRVVYRYVYCPNTPVVRVSARYERGDDREWSEVHFLHLSRKERGPYQKVTTGAPVVSFPLNAKGTESLSRTGRSWCVMSDGQNGCGVGGKCPVFWDASSDFVYYLRGGLARWDGPERLRMKGCLYFGTAVKTTDPLPWLDPARQPEISFWKDGKPSLLLDTKPLAGTHYLENGEMRIAFGSAAEGFDCLGILNTTSEPMRFVYPHDQQAGLWRLDFRGPSNAKGVRERFAVDNHAKARKRFAERKGETLFFHWEGIDLPREPGALDVTVSIALPKPKGVSGWRISLKNRSARWGLWSTDFPYLSSVVPSGKGDLVAPTGNWGGSLRKRSDAGLTLPYPSCACPVQCLAYQLGGSGLYIGAHDGNASAKTLVVQDTQDVTWRQIAANAGVPGSAIAPEFPVVIAAYSGTWWKVPQIYRNWALRQRWTSRGPIFQRKDYPKNLQDLCFWMISSGVPKNVEKGMEKAGLAFSGLKVGTHWYNWHQIPFDNSYPEYFPTKPGVADAARRMVREGMVIMPYINGRLWDRDIASFAEARPSACRQEGGDIYVEHYGKNPRNLAPMCPATECWQKKVGTICQRLVDEVGVNAIYLDQIGAARPALCFDPSHGHPVGGGHHWVDGYRNLLTPIKKYCSERGVALTTENTAEPYMDNIDGFLTWSPRFESDLPLLPAIYSGYTVYFGTPQAQNDDLDAFCAAQGRDFLWGVQPGWNYGWILNDQSRQKREFQQRLCSCRKISRDFLLYGQLLGDIHFDSPIPVSRHLWNRNHPHDAVLPDVLGTLWRAPDGRFACFLVNTSGVSHRVAFRLSMQGEVGKASEVCELLPGGEKGPPINTLDLITAQIPARAPVVYLVSCH